MNNATTTTILTAEPQLFVSNMEASLAFYVGKLGFKVTFSHGEPPFYAQVSRGGARLNLRRADSPVFDRDFRRREADALSATLTLDVAEPLYREYQAAGVGFFQMLRTEPWGASVFIVEDPDGNLIAFAVAPAVD